MKRLFAAIKISPDKHFLKIYYQLISQLKEEHIKWVEPNNLHLTLKFFGETEENRIGNICSDINEVAGEFKPFSFQLKGVGIFGSSYKPRVIWFGIDDNTFLKVLGNTMLNKLTDAGFPNDRQNFVPHLTVGRIKQLRHKSWFQTTINQLKQEYIQEISVDEIILFDSILERNGPRYHAIEKFKLR